MLLTKELVTNVTKRVYHLPVPVGIHEGVNCTVAIVTELDKLQEAVNPQRGGEMLWVVRCHDTDNKQWQPSYDKQHCYESNRSGQSDFVVVGFLGHAVTCEHARRS